MSRGSDAPCRALPKGLVVLARGQRRAWTKSGTGASTYVPAQGSFEGSHSR